MKKITVFLTLFIFIFPSWGQSPTEAILTSIQNKISLTQSQKESIEKALSEKKDYFDLDGIISPFLEEAQLEVLFKKQIISKATALAQTEINYLNFCKEPTTAQLNKIKSILVEKYADQLVLLKKYGDTPEGLSKLNESEYRHDKLKRNYLFISNLRDAKYSEIFAYQDMLQLSENQKNAIAEAYNKRVAEFSEIKKNGKYDSKNDKQINKRYSQSLEKILTAEQYDFYLGLLCKGKAQSRLDLTMAELQKYDLVTNENQEKAKNAVYNYYLEVEKTNKRYANDDKTRIDTKERLEANRPKILVQLKHAKKFSEQGKKYQGNFQW